MNAVELAPSLVAKGEQAKAIPGELTLVVRKMESWLDDQLHNYPGSELGLRVTPPQHPSHQ